MSKSKPRIATEIQHTPPDQLIPVAALAHQFGVSPVTLWRWRQRPDFPPAIRVSRRTVLYRRSEIERWLRKQEAVIG